MRDRRPGLSRATALPCMRSAFGLLAAILLSGPVYGQCEAYYPFDGDLSDASGNGNDGTMIAAEGASATAQFDAGVQGQALKLDGSSAMRTYLDLHFESCPRFTITGWVRADPNAGSTGFFFSTGAGGTPALRKGGRSASLAGAANGLYERDAFRDARAWFFFAGVYDYDAGTYRFQWRNRVVEGSLNDAPRAPEDAFWVGAYNDRLRHPVEDGYIDELRITGRVLSKSEIDELRAGLPPALSGNGEQMLRIAAISAGALQSAAGQFSRAGPGTTITVDQDDLPDRPPLGPVNLAAPDDEIALLDTPETYGGGTPDASLTMSGDDPGSRLQGELDALPDSPTFEKVDELHCEPPESVDPYDPGLMSNYTLIPPERFRNALSQAKECRLMPQVVTINDSDQWVIAAGNEIARTQNIPAALAQKLDEFEDNGVMLDLAEITNDGRWVVAGGGEYTHSGLPLKARARLSSILRAGGKVVSFSAHPSDSERWLMVDGEGNVYGEPLPWQLNIEMSQRPLSERRFLDARYMADGSWVAVGEDHWFLSNGAASSVLTILRSHRDKGYGYQHFRGYKSAASSLIVSHFKLPKRNMDYIWTVENSIAGSNIWERMAEHGVTGAAVAVVRNNEIHWTRGYGLRESGDPESYVLTNTTFDFASVSKAVAAFALMQLVDEGKIDIEKTGGLEDIEALIPPADLADFRATLRPERGNIVQVMQHCAGLCYALAEDCDDGFVQGGAEPYATNPIPNTRQVLLGSPPADADHRTVRDGEIGKVSRYTSANYVMLQALIDVHGGGFVSHTSKLFNDLGMASTTFVSPYPKRNDGNFARGHTNGVMKPIRSYGELAAASLVSTAADIARFVIALNENGGDLLSSSEFDKLVGRDASVMGYCDDPGSMALGIRRSASIESWDDAEVIWHHGLHNGYRARMIALPGRQRGLVLVMTGTLDATNAFYNEFKASLVETFKF